MDEGDFRAMVLNSTIAAVAGAKGLDPTAFSLRRFIAGADAEASMPISDEAKLDALLGVRN